jgi:hypothetical protein
MNPPRLVIGVTVFRCVFWVLSDCVLLPLRARRPLNKVLRRVGGDRVAPRDYKFETKQNDLGFSVQAIAQPMAVPDALQWTEVSRVSAYKRDLFRVDLICLLFSRSERRGIEVDEEMKGWRDFVEALPKRLPRCKKRAEWLLPIATPAFAINPMEIYSRSPHKPTSGRPA